MFPSWLEYSPTSDGAYCLTCYLFSSKPDDPCSLHNNAMKAYEDLLNQSMHINNIINVL